MAAVSPSERRDSLLYVLTKETGIQDYAAESGRASASPESPGADSSGGMVPRRDSVLQTDYRGSPRVSFEAPRVSFDTGAPPSAAEYARSPARGDADWVDEYGFVGDSEGRRRATLARKATLKNPWKTVQNKSVRMKKVPTSAMVQTLDYEARQRAWYCLDMDRDNAVAMLENLEDILPDGAFVVSNSRREFAMITFIVNGNLTTVPLDADVKGVWLKLNGVKSPPRFKSLSDLVAFYSTKKQKGMPCKLQTKALESVLDKVAANGWFPGDAEEGDFIDPTLRQGAMINPGYSPAMPAREGGMINPGYVGAGVPAGVQPGYELIDPAESEGFIQISRTSFTCADGIYGVTFQPCQTDQWFFMGLSNIHQNHHGRRDRHYDDIDFCIGVMGHGKATARENEDEVGPYIDYKAKDTFTIRVIPKKKIVEYAKNKKVFHVSTLPKDKLPLWALQAFHPINGGQLLIQNSNWLYKF